MRIFGVDDNSNQKSANLDMNDIELENMQDPYNIFQTNTG